MPYQESKDKDGVYHDLFKNFGQKLAVQWISIVLVFLAHENSGMN